MTCCRTGGRFCGWKKKCWTPLTGARARWWLPRYRFPVADLDLWPSVVDFPSWPLELCHRRIQLDWPTLHQIRQEVLVTVVLFSVFLTCMSIVGIFLNHISHVFFYFDLIPFFLMSYIFHLLLWHTLIPSFFVHNALCNCWIKCRTKRQSLIIQLVTPVSVSASGRGTELLTAKLSLIK